MRVPPILLLALVAACAAPGEREGAERPLSPFVDRENRPQGEVTQVRPFYRKEVSGDTKRVDVLGPLIRYREDAHFRRLQIFPLVFYTARKAPQELKSWWFILFPFLWLGSDDFLVLPLGGYSKDSFLGINDFLMVGPFYIRAKRISSDPVDPVTFTSHNILWPFIRWGSDGRPGGRRSFRFWPFYRHAITREGGKRGFVLWPFYTWSRERDANQFHLWPFYGRRVTPILREQTVLFPIIQYREDLLTGGTDFAVWPFYRRARSEGQVVSRYWPLYEYRRVGFTTTEYAFWPFLRRTWVDEAHQFAKYTWVVPFYTNVRKVSRETGVEEKKTLVWPLVRRISDSEGYKEVAVPILWPVDNRYIREWGEPIRPFISIYQSRRKRNGEREASALFGLVMTRRKDEARKTTLLYGLVGWERVPEGRYLRLLWGIRLRLGDSR